MFLKNFFSTYLFFIHFVSQSIKVNKRHRITQELIKSKFTDLDIIARTLGRYSSLTKLIAIQAYLENAVPLKSFLYSFTLNECLLNSSLSIPQQIYLLKKSQFCLGLQAKDGNSDRIIYASKKCNRRLEITNLEVEKGQINLLLELNKSPKITFIHEAEQDFSPVEVYEDQKCYLKSYVGMNYFTLPGWPKCGFPWSRAWEFMERYRPYDKKAVVPILVYDYSMEAGEFVFRGIGIADHSFETWRHRTPDCDYPRIFFISKKLNWSWEDLEENNDLPSYGEEFVGNYNVKFSTEIFELGRD